MMRYHSINNNKCSEEDLQIACPFCEYEMEGLEMDNGKLDKDFIPSHYCSPLSDNVMSSCYKIDNKWIKEKD